MSDSRTISAVAASTGFTASALRFYEDAGLINPNRTRAGYRVYDDRAVERLRFISRAKQLGLRLDEITELLTLWNDDQCAPVAGRLADLIDAKISDTQARVADLIAFAADLQRFRVALAPETATGSCGDGCACHGSSTATIACTLEPSDVRRRMTDWQVVLSRTTNPPQPVPGGVTVHFPADAELAASVAALAAAEHSCCSFFTFTLQIDSHGTHLTVTAPGEAASLISALFGASV
jgi:DNA-binding transcriptional MerR regulator